MRASMSTYARDVSRLHRIRLDEFRSAQARLGQIGLDGTRSDQGIMSTSVRKLGASRFHQLRSTAKLSVLNKVSVQLYLHPRHPRCLGVRCYLLGGGRTSDFFVVMEMALGLAVRAAVLF
jgi:hypothetical protein